MKSPDHHRLFATSQDQLATAFGVEVRTVWRWLRNGAPGKTSDGYDVAAWIAWWAESKADMVAPEDGTAAEADRRWKLARAAREEMRMAKERGELIPVAEAEARLLEFLRWVIGVFERAGTETSTLTAGKRPAEHRRLINEYFREVRLDACREQDRRQPADQSERNRRNVKNHSSKKRPVRPRAL